MKTQQIIIALLSSIAMCQGRNGAPNGSTPVGVNQVGASLLHPNAEVSGPAANSQKP